MTFLLCAAVATYCVLVLLLMTPRAQTHVVYAHRFALSGTTPSGFKHPEDYGLAPGKTINLRLRAQDGTSLGAWFVLSEPAYRSLPSPLEPKRTIDDDAANTTDTAEALIRHALSTSPTFLFLHGNSGTRALPRRIALYTALTARVPANVLALDYRGFGDSAGRPSVAGVAMDARAAWDWLTRVHGARPRDVLVVGHSLGTAVAGMLANSTLGARHAGSDSKSDSDAGMDTYMDTDTPPAVHRARLVQRTEVPHFGVLHEFVAPAGTGGRRVVLLKTRYGGHDVGWVEGVQDVLRGVFGFV